MATSTGVYIENEDRGKNEWKQLSSEKTYSFMGFDLLISQGGLYMAKANTTQHSICTSRRKGNKLQKITFVYYLAQNQN